MVIHVLSDGCNTSLTVLTHTVALGDVLPNVLFIFVQMNSLPKFTSAVVIILLQHVRKPTLWHEVGHQTCMQELKVYDTILATFTICSDYSCIQR